MATATQKSRAVKRPGRQAHVPEAMEFRVFEDNGGSHHWTIVAANGASLARSGGFASHEDAEQAAQQVRDAAPLARFERRAKRAIPIGPTAYRDGATDADTERWSDEGGGSSSHAVTR